MNLISAVYIVNIVMSLQIRYWNNSASNIGTTVDQSWHDNVVNVGMPIQILGWPKAKKNIPVFRVTVF